MVVLGMSIGTRQSGIAIITNRELVIWQMLTINTETQIHQQVLSRYIVQFRVSVVIIKLPPETHITTGMKELLHSLLALFRRFGCSIHHQTDKSIKATLPAIINKQDIIELVTDLYPDLVPEKEKESTQKNNYYIKLFEAVLVAHQFQLSDSPPY